MKLENITGKLTVLFLVISFFLAIYLFYQIGSASFPEIVTQSTTSQPQNKLLVEVCQTGVANMLAITPEGSQLPDNLRDAPLKRMETDFDVNNYFIILDHLSMQKGYTLDYINFPSALGTYPILYVRPETQPRFSIYNEFSQAFETAKKEHGKVIFTQILNYIEVEDTPEGFLQLAIFDMMAEQFYLEWHANYSDDTIICSPQEAGKILTDLINDGLKVSNEVWSAAQSLNYAPTIKMEKDTVTVRVIYFTKWGGFYEHSFIYNRNFPHKFLDYKEKILIEYDCGYIM